MKSDEPFDPDATEAEAIEQLMRERRVNRHTAQEIVSFHRNGSDMVMVPKSPREK